MKTHLEKQIPQAKISKNEVPKSLHQIDDKQYENCYFDTKTNKITTFPRIGAFEVYFNEILIFSKLKCKFFPKIDFLINNLTRISEEISKGDNVEKYDLFQNIQENHICQESDFRANPSLKQYYMNKAKMPTKTTLKNKLFFPKMDLTNCEFDDDFLNYSSTASSKQKKKPEVYVRTNNYIEENKKIKVKKQRKKQNFSFSKNNSNCYNSEQKPHPVKKLVINGPFTIFNKKTIGNKRFEKSFLIFEGNLRRSQSLHENNKMKNENSLIKVAKEETFIKNSPIKENESGLISLKNEENPLNFQNNEEIVISAIKTEEESLDSHKKPHEIQQINENNQISKETKSIQFSQEKFKAYLRTLDPEKTHKFTETVPVEPKESKSIQYSKEKFKEYLKSTEPVKIPEFSQTKIIKTINQETQFYKNPCESTGVQYSKNKIGLIDKSLETANEKINQNQETQTKEKSLKDADIQFSQGNFVNFLKTLEPIKLPKETQTKVKKTDNKEIQSKSIKNGSIGVQYSRNLFGLMEKSVGVCVDTRDEFVQKSNNNEQINKSISMTESFKIRQRIKQRSMHTSYDKMMNIKNKSIETCEIERKDEAIQKSNNEEIKIEKATSVSNSFKLRHVPSKLNKSIETEELHKKDKEIIMSESFKNSQIPKKKEATTSYDNKMNIIEQSIQTILVHHDDQAIQKNNEELIDKGIVMSDSFRSKQLPLTKDVYSSVNNIKEALYIEQKDEQTQTSQKMFINKSVSMSNDLNNNVDNVKNEKKLINLVDQSVQMSQSVKENNNFMKEFHNKSLETFQIEKKDEMVQLSIKEMEDKAISMSFTFKNQNFNENSENPLKGQPQTNEETQYSNQIIPINKSIQVNINENRENIIENENNKPELLDENTSISFKNINNANNQPLEKSMHQSLCLMINQSTQVSGNFRKDMENQKFISETKTHPNELFKKIETPLQTNSRYSNYQNFEPDENYQPSIQEKNLHKKANSQHEFSPEFTIKNKIKPFSSLKDTHQKPTKSQSLKKEPEFSHNNLEISHGDRIIKSADYRKPIFFKESRKYRKKSGVFGSQKIISSRNVLIVLNEQDLRQIESLLGLEGLLIDSEAFKKKDQSFKQQVLLIVKEPSGVKSIFAFNDPKELRSRINVNKIDEVFLSDLTELNFIEFEKLKENLKAGHIKEIFYMDEDFVLGKISQNCSKSIKKPSISPIKAKGNRNNIAKSLDNLMKNEYDRNIFEWRVSCGRERFPLISSINENIPIKKNIQKKISIISEEDSLKVSKNYKTLLEQEQKNGVLLGSLQEIIEMDFKEFKEHVIKKEQDLKIRHKLVLLGVKEKFQRSADDFKALKLIQEVYSSLSSKKTNLIL